MIFHGGLGVQLSQFNSPRTQNNHQERLNRQFDLLNPYTISSWQFQGSVLGESNSSKVSADNIIENRQNRRIGCPTASSTSVHNTAFSGALIATMPPKRNASGEPNGSNAPVAKHIKSEQHPEEFSNTVKKKLLASTRTGQACDRCKVRKIRCDGLAGGCSPCIQNHNECKTTDRITGRATSRGYVEGIEQQNRDLQLRIQELEHRLMQGGADIKPANGYPDSASGQYGYGQSSNGMQSTWSTTGPAYTSPTSATANNGQQQETNMFRALPAYRAGCMGDNYLGVSPGSSHLSAIKGTALSILGMEIDIADFRSTDMDEPDPSVFHPQLYNKSYQSFLQSAWNVNPRIEKVELPARSEAIIYAEWYFRVINPYCPLLHRGTFMRLLSRMYDDPTFRPTTAENVIVHMLFAIMFFQYATRNWEDAEQQASLNSQSNTHYHYCLGMFYQLACSHTAQDIQALALICLHLRNFPKPGASWVLARMAMTLAIELGLHRSMKRWAPESNTLSELDIEMRRRTFWVILAVNVTLSGKLGRPMPLRNEDYDVECPSQIDDDYIPGDGIDPPNPIKCNHEIGIQGFKLIPCYLELYSTIYSISRQPSTYVATVNRLEAKIRAWKDDLPPELVNGELGHNEQEGRVFALYAQSWSQEFRLLLRHPSVSMTTDPDFNAESMRICVESSRQMLGVVRQLQKYKSLDTTWYNTSVFVMALTTTLFAQWEKRGGTSSADLAALREEMDIWLDIMGDIGSLLGSGTRLKKAVQVVTDGTLGLLSRNLPAKNDKSYASNNNGQEEVRPTEQTSNTNGNNGYPVNAQNYNYNEPTSATGSAPAPNYSPSEGQMSHQQTPYPAATQYSPYLESASNTSDLTYAQPENQGYGGYPASTSDSVEAPLIAALAAQASQVAPNTWQRNSTQVNTAPTQAWQHWTSTVTGNLEPQECYSASALMQLGGRDMSNGDTTQLNTSMGDVQSGGVGEPGHLGGQVSGAIAGAPTWPLNLFDIGVNGSTG
ncbi:putative transcription factor cys6 protein [Botrytis fragariae]|uniref:Putative transcription factor cys6 protein n=1 Tax=Botrytis fragariae TaxID=1964551 RepID=A0A8H6ARJ9_9HELO|nr:putative transcription factor cys6 protein [Botrytis fragariae]KAF5872090.1 putative transcription factor cys6 protein [Botrytis fragariae]